MINMIDWLKSIEWMAKAILRWKQSSTKIWKKNINLFNDDWVSAVDDDQINLVCVTWWCIFLCKTEAVTAESSCGTKAKEQVQECRVKEAYKNDSRVKIISTHTQKLNKKWNRMKRWCTFYMLYINWTLIHNDSMLKQSNNSFAYPSAKYH